MDRALDVRTAVPDDLSELQRVFVDASLSNEGDVDELRAHPEMLVFDGEHVEAGLTRVAVRPEVPARVLGFATVVVGPDGEPDLEDLFVDSSLRRQGIARLLVSDAVDRARADGHRCLWVTGNEHALAFYEAVGFVVVGVAETPLRSAPRLRLDVGSAPVG